MIPQLPEYIVTFEAAVRLLVAAIALGLIWMGAARMEGPARSRYATAGVLSAAFIAWLAVAQYLGSANSYFATGDNAVPTVLFGLLTPVIAAAVGVLLSASMARLVSAIPLQWIVVAQVFRMASRNYVLSQGRIIAEGTAAGLMSNQTLRASYLGL